MNLKSFVFINALLIVFSGSFSGALECADSVSAVVSDHKYDATFARLPSKNSPAFRVMVDEVSRQFQANKSFAIIDLRPFIPESVGSYWHNSVPHDVPTQIVNSEIVKSTKPLSLSPAESWQLEGIHKLEIWMKDLIQVSQAQISLEGPFTNVRFTTPQGEGISFDEWHVDGGYVSALLALKGPGVEILGGASPRSLSAYHGIRGEQWEKECPDCKPFVVPTGHAAIFMGSVGSRDGWKPTVHRSPHGKKERVLFVIRY